MDTVIYAEVANEEAYLFPAVVLFGSTNPSPPQLSRSVWLAIYTVLSLTLSSLCVMGRLDCEGIQSLTPLWQVGIALGSTCHTPSSLPHPASQL
jgi:hypothetical protein